MVPGQSSPVILGKTPAIITSTHHCTGSLANAVAKNVGFFKGKGIESRNKTHSLQMLFIQKIKITYKLCINNWI